MKQGLLHVVLFVALLVTSCMAAEIGIYFDMAATVNCLPEAATFPFVTQAYVMATNCRGFGGIRGWEVRLAWDSPIIVNAGVVSGQPINIRTFPQYMVGLANALPDSDTVVLSQLSVLALGPGGIYLQGLGISAPDSMPALLFENVVEPQAATYRFGSRTEHSASIGVLPCPAIPVPSSPTLNTAMPVEEPLAVFVNPPPYAGLKNSGMYISPNADVAFCGIVIRGERRCVDFPERIAGVVGDAAGVIQVDIDVTEVFWGVIGSRATVYVLGYEVAGCNLYGQPWPVPPADLVVSGATCLVGAQDMGGTFVVSMTGSFDVVGPALDGHETKEIRARWMQFSEREQLESADVTIDAELIGVTNTTFVFRTIRSVRGAAEETVTVPAHDASGALLPVGQLGQVSRLYLVRVADHYVPLHGRLSVQKIRRSEK